MPKSTWCQPLSSPSIVPYAFVDFYEILLMLLIITLICLVYVPSSIVILNITGKEIVFLVIYQCDH